jgi:hypothetical protein
MATHAVPPKAAPISDFCRVESGMRGSKKPALV